LPKGGVYLLLSQPYARRHFLKLSLADLCPLSLSRPVFMLASGMSTLLDKQVRYLSPTRLTLWVRPGLEAFCASRSFPYALSDCRQ